MQNSLINKLSGKQSSPDKKPTAGTGNAMAFAHYLGLPGRVAAAAKSAPAMVQAAAAKLTRKPAASPAPAPRAAAPTAAAPATDTARIKQAIAAERARGAEIVAAGIKAGRVNQACTLAFDTDLSATEAVSALSAAALDAAASISDSRRIRMGLNPAAPTADKPQFDPKATADQIIAAGEKASGQTAARASSNPSTNRIIAAGERARGE